MKKSIIINNLIKQTRQKSMKEVDKQIQDIIYKINNNQEVESFGFYKKSNSIIRLTINEKTFYLRLFVNRSEEIYTKNIRVFINYLSSHNYDIKMIERLLFFFYGDLSYNNIGTTRYSFNELKEKFPNKLIILNNYLNSYVFNDTIIDKLVFSNDNLSCFISYLLVYDNGKFYLFERNQVKKLLLSRKYRYSSIHIGPFVLNNKKRNIDFDKDFEYRRQYLVIKWHDYLKHLLVK